MIIKQVIRYDNAPWLEATWVDEEGINVKCRAYSGDQMNELRIDLGDDASDYESMIVQCEEDFSVWVPENVGT